MSVWSFSVVVVSLVTSAACGSSRQVESEEPKKASASYPAWVDDVPAGCGVGIAAIQGSLSSARTTAISRARAELSRSLEATVRSMVKDYQSQGRDGVVEFSEDRTVLVARELSEKTLYGTRPRAGAMVGEEEQEYYSLVCLDPAAFAAALEGLSEVSDAAKNALKVRAEEEFRDMDRFFDAAETAEDN